MVSISAHVRPTALVAVAVVACVYLTGCATPMAEPVGADDGVPVATADAATGTASPVTTEAPVAASFPLLGLPATSQAAATRPIVAVAVATGDGLPAADGLEAADLVYVSFPGAERQRALALFQSADADRVGPVAETRPLDPKLLVVTGAVLEHSGGAAGFVKQLDAAAVPQLSATEEPASFVRDTSGQWYASTAVARSATGARPARPGLLPYSTASASTDDAAVPGPVTIDVSAQPRLHLSFDASKGSWSGRLGGLSVTATNVIVQEVAHEELSLPRSGGRTETNPNPVGRGRATALSGATVTSGTWNRRSRTRLTNVVAADGTPVRLVPGPTWVLLVPPGTEVTT